MWKSVSKNLFVIKSIRKILFLIIALLLVVIVFLLLFNENLGAPVDASNTSDVFFEVQSGASPIDVTNELHEEGLIKDFDYFYNLFLEDGGTLYANTYQVSPSMSSNEIYDIITSSASNVNMDDATSLLIFEGETVDQVADDVANLLDMSKDEIIEYWGNQDNLNSWIGSYSVLTDEILNEDIIYPLEGYLYPATYVIDEGETLESLTTKILETTQENYEPYLSEDLVVGYTFHEVLSLSAVVERETMHEVDRPKVAGVFYNRIEAGMPLQSDITVLYGIGEHKEIVTYEDLEYDSPYNTYLYTGVPPSPISSVSKESLEATINPTESNYLYFFAKQDSGEVLYSETYEEHLVISEQYAWE